MLVCLLFLWLGFAEVVPLLELQDSVAGCDCSTQLLLAKERID